MSTGVNQAQADPVLSFAYALESQLQILNSVLKTYKAEIHVWKIKRRGESCDTCMDIILSLKFHDRDLYEKLISITASPKPEPPTEGGV